MEGQNDNCNKSLEAEQYSGARRRFLKLAIAALGSLSGLVLGIPFLRTVIRSAPAKKTDWSIVGDVSSMAAGTPQKMNFQSSYEDAYLRGTTVRSVWVLKDEKGSFIVYSPVCTHLGCYYTWNAASGRFECPCHASVFSVDGKVLGGPAPRPLDRLPHKVDNGKLFVRWEEFKSGTPKQIGI